MRLPCQIVQAGVGWVPIKMGALHPRRARSYKGFEYEMVDIPLYPCAIFETSHSDPEVAPLSDRPRLQDNRARAAPLARDRATNPPETGDFVARAPFHVPPFLCVHWTIIP